MKRPTLVQQLATGAVILAFFGCLGFSPGVLMITAVVILVVMVSQLLPYD